MWLQPPRDITVTCGVGAVVGETLGDPCLAVGRPRPPRDDEEPDRFQDQ